MTLPTQPVYTFGAGRAEGKADMKELLGGKGANLAEMNRIGLPVPPGFTLTTEVCNYFTRQGRDATFELIQRAVEEGVRHMESIMSRPFGDTDDPLLLSVRSGARVSMPGMMDTVLNIGINAEVVEGIIRKGGNERFAWDSYRRFIQMYGDVVMGLKPESDKEEDPFERVIQQLKTERGLVQDLQLTAEDFKTLTDRFEQLIQDRLGKPFPTDPWEQLWGAVFAVFESWNNNRAKVYRRLNHIPEDWGTAVNVQAMVYGNLGDHSATGVAFTRDAATGEDLFNGEFLINAQGEDVVAGVRTPQQVSLEGSRRWAQLTGVPEEERRANYPSLEELMPEVYEKLLEYETRLEDHYRDMQDIEFTIQEGTLWILQTRNGKRTGQAMVRIAMDMLEQGMIDEKTALLRMDPERLEDLLHPVFEETALNGIQVLARGLPASPGAATGRVVFFADDAETWATEGIPTILVRQETSPEDLHGMSLAKGILTVRGGMTSHAAIVARGMGKCCVAGAESLQVSYQNEVLQANGISLKKGDWISLNGNTGEVYPRQIPTQDPKIDDYFARLMQLADRHARLAVRTNADTPDEADIARRFGAQGIGLCRTEHMFFGGNRVAAVREMILAQDEAGRRKALDKLLPMQRADFEGLFRVMDGTPVTIRLLDPPLHEFLPHDMRSQEELAKDMHMNLEAIQAIIENLDEVNPMLGHRGCRLGITFPEITEMQTRAIIEAALNVKQEGVHLLPEIMVPLIGRQREFRQQDAIIRDTAAQVFRERGDRIDFQVGTMIEIPRAAITADLIAEYAEFFSFGTNDLTQMTFGFSRDDIGKFLPIYLDKGIMDFDPFEQIDENGVGRLVRHAVEKGRESRPELKLGICGEHGGNPASIDFFERTGLDYVSCSPYRVPVARLVAAQARLRQQEG